MGKFYRAGGEISYLWLQTPPIDCNHLKKFCRPIIFSKRSQTSKCFFERLVHLLDFFHITQSANQGGLLVFATFSDFFLKKRFLSDYMVPECPKNTPG